MTQCCMGQDCPSVLLYMMHSNNNNNIAKNKLYSCLDLCNVSGTLSSAVVQI